MKADPEAPWNLTLSSLTLPIDIESDRNDAEVAFGLFGVMLEAFDDVVEMTIIREPASRHGFGRLTGGGRMTVFEDYVCDGLRG